MYVGVHVSEEIADALQKAADLEAGNAMRKKGNRSLIHRRILEEWFKGWKKSNPSTKTKRA